MTDHANELRRHARKIPHPQGETPGVMLRAADEIERLQRVIASPHSMTRDEVIRMAREAWTLEFIPDSDVSKLERFASIVAAAERNRIARAALTPAPTESAEDDDLYWRLHAMSKSLEGAGRIDEHENPDAYATVLDAMAFVRQRGCGGA